MIRRDAVRTISLDGTRDQLEDLISASARADYVYMYPPRQCYRPLARTVLDPLVETSLGREGPLNLYFHFPFCAQICAFCNLFAVRADAKDDYVYYEALIEKELAYYATLIQGRRVDTVYLGGGTPSMLPPKLFGQIFERLSALGICDVRQVPEVAIEMSPETATRDRLAELHRLGINRVNLGVQSMDDHELHLIGRSYQKDTPLNALDAALSIGFDNVCVDLIYGLLDQTRESWERSVDDVVARGPATVCAYPLTLRPRTGFSARGYTQVSDREQYARYDYADSALRAAGYKQETHVRWILSGGGYRQKTNHWAGQDVVGIGAGARGYLWNADYRNGYSVRSRRSALRSWAQRVEESGHGRCDGFVMDQDERARKSLILGLNNLDRQQFEATHHLNIGTTFGNQLTALAKLGLLEDDGERLALTRMGVRFRDVIVQSFFSIRVRNLIAAFSYDE